MPTFESDYFDGRNNCRISRENVIGRREKKLSTVAMEDRVSGNWMSVPRRQFN